MRAPVSDSEPSSRGVRTGTRWLAASAASIGRAPGAASGGAVPGAAPGAGGATVPSCAVSAGGWFGACSSGGNRKNQSRSTRKLSAVARIRFLLWSSIADRSPLAGHGSGRVQQPAARKVKA